MLTSKRSILPIACCLLLTLASCSSAPTFRKEHVAESIREILSHDHIDATVRLIDHTLAVQFEYPNALARSNETISVGLGFEEAARKVITAIHRVLLSSDADVHFYLLLLSDPQLPGAYLTMVRSLEDIRKMNVSIIGVSEMTARTVFELNVADVTPPTLDQYLPREIQLSDFLTWQLTRRLRQELTKTLQPLGEASVGRCEGRFSDGEFAFTLNVVPTSNEPLNTQTVQLVFDTATQLIARVLSDYGFESFDAVRLIHPLTGQHSVMPRARLEFVR